MIQVRDINITYDGVTVIRDSSIVIPAGKLCLITSESGTGKSSLFNLLALNSGLHHAKYIFNGIDVNTLTENEKDVLRREKISFVSQNNLLMSNFTVVTHLKLVEELSSSNHRQDESISKLLKELNLIQLKDKKIKRLSGGEKQRVAIACALLKDADLYIFDEPTAMLDNENKKVVTDLIKRVVDKGKSVIVATHEKEYFNDYIEYTIQNNQIILLSEIECSEDNIQTKLTQRAISKTLSHLSLNYFFSSPFLKAAYLFLITCCISFSAVVTTVSYANLKEQKDSLDKMYQAQLQIVNNSIDKASLMDVEFFLPVATETLDNIKQISHIQSVDPFIYFNSEMQCIDGNTEMSWITPHLIDKMTLKKDSKEVKTIHYTEAFDSPFVIYPTYDYQDYDGRCNKVLDENGIYITKSLADQLGIKEVNGETLTMTIIIPIAETASVTTSSSGQFLSREPLGVVKELTFTVKGILEEETYARYEGAYVPKMFLPIDKMLEIQEMARLENLDILNTLMETEQSDSLIQKYFPYVLKNNVWKASSYVIKVDNANNISEVIKNIISVDSELSVSITDLSTDMEVNTTLVEEIQKSAIVYPTIILIVLVIGITIIKIFHIKSRKQDIQYLKINGLDERNYKTILNREQLLELLVIGPLLILLTIILFSITNKRTPMDVNYSFETMLLEILILLVVIYSAFFISTISFRKTAKK